MKDKDKSYLPEFPKDSYKLPNNSPVKFHLVRSLYSNVDSVIGFGYIKDGDLHIPKYPQFKAGNTEVLTGKELENSLYGKDIKGIEKQKVRKGETWREDEGVIPNVYKDGKPFKMRPNKEMGYDVPVFVSNVYDMSGIDANNKNSSGSEYVYTDLRDNVGYRLSYFPVDYDPNKLKNPKPKYEPYVHNYGSINKNFDSSVLRKDGHLRRIKMDNEALKKFTDNGGVIIAQDTNKDVVFKGNFDDYQKFLKRQPKNKTFKLDFNSVNKQHISKPVYRDEQSVYTKDVMYSKYVNVRRDPKNEKLNDYELFNKFGVFNPWDKRFKDEASKLRKE